MNADAGPGPSTPGPRTRRRAPAWLAVLLLGITACALVTVVLLAARAGPLVAHPPTVPPHIPPPVTMQTLSAPPLPTLPPTQPQEQPSFVWQGLLLTAIGVVLVVLLVVWLVRAWRRPGRTTAPQVAPQATAVSPSVLGWDDGEQDGDTTEGRTFSARRAADEIIAAWAALEQAATVGGYGRLPASTPTEFLESLTERVGDADIPGSGAGAGAGAVAGADAGAGAASITLLRLYHRARFDTAALSPGAAARARVAARALAGRMDAAGAMPTGQSGQTGEGSGQSVQTGERTSPDEPGRDNDGRTGPGGSHS